MSASRDVDNAVEQIYLMQNKQNIRADSAEVNAGLSANGLQVRVTIMAIFCMKHDSTILTVDR